MSLTHRLISALVVCVGISDAWTANRTPVFPKAAPVHLASVKHEPEFCFGKQIVKTIGVLSLGSMLALNAGDVFASESMPFLSSSTQQLAMEVKTMDLSLPSSYDTISGAKSTGASLAKEIERTGTMPTNKVQREKSNEKASSSLASNLLPSMNKSTKKAPKEKERVQQAEEKEEKTFENIKIVDMEMPSYSSTLQKEKSAFSF